MVDVEAKILALEADIISIEAEIKATVKKQGLTKDKKEKV